MSRRVRGVCIAALAVTPFVPRADAAEAPDALLLGMSIHVEGYHEERYDEAVFRPHEALVYGAAVEAEAAGAVLTFEFSPIFADAVATWGSSLPADVVAMGHGIGVHADIGGMGEVLTVEEFAAALIPMRETVSSQTGVAASHVSGICSPGPWVEGAILAGFASASGSVEYCALSLDEENVPPGYEDLDCASASVCHGTFPDDLEHQLHPWQTSDSGDWLRDDPEGELTLFAGAGGVPLTCLAENGAEPCVADSADAAAYGALVGEFVAAREAGEANAFTLTRSIGGAAPDGWMHDLLAAAAPYVAAGEALWSSLPGITAVAATTVQETVTTPFTDIAASYAAAEITELYALGITGGTTPTTFSPAAPVTREQMAVFLANTYETTTALVCPGLPGPPFEDMSGSYAEGDIECIAELGMTAGVSPGVYGPREAVTREQLAVFLVRLYAAASGVAPPPGTTPFTDTAASFARDEIGALVGLGVTSGTTSTTFSPAGAVTREQMAVFLVRLIEAIG